MIEWLGIEHLFELSPTEAIAGFLTPLVIFAVFLVALQPLGAAAHNSRRQIRYSSSAVLEKSAVCSSLLKLEMISV